LGRAERAYLVSSIPTTAALMQVAAVPENSERTPKLATSDPTLTAPGYEEVIFTDATMTCVWRVEGPCI